MAANTDSIYDICIVGAGMVGSSAAKYASLDGASKVCLIGPEEPQHRAGHTIFGAHFDEARITRSTATDFTWAVLSTRSIARYRQIEAEAGVRFYEEVGCLTIGDPTDGLFRETNETTKKLRIAAENISAAEVQRRFPYLNVAPSYRCVAETSNAGYINPRKLVQAQQKIATKNGCHLIRDIVSSVIQVTLPANQEVVQIETDGGRKIYSRKVLLATGAFTEFRSLLPKGFHFDLHPVTESVIFLEMSQSDIEKLKQMPSMLVKVDSTDATDSYDCYILPPVRYPDGKVFLKLGHGHQFNRELNSPAEIAQWYQSTVPQEVEDGLKNIFEKVFKDIKPISLHTDTCVTVHTTTGRPFIDLIPGRQMGVALGGNGCSAKCCDEFGRLAIELLVKEEWQDAILSKQTCSMIVAPDKSQL
jgi:sarcosine oxidase/L-pipecolate oxidase